MPEHADRVFGFDGAERNKRLSESVKSWWIPICRMVARDICEAIEPQVVQFQRGKATCLERILRHAEYWRLELAGIAVNIDDRRFPEE